MGGNRHSLTPREKELYQNIHPATLATDIGVFLPSTYLIWIHGLVLGVLIAFIPDALKIASCEDCLIWLQ
jgi:hypothetical protein